MKLRSISRIIVISFVVCIVVMGSQSLRAAEWPSKPITIIMPWGAGGSSDLLTRMLADALERGLGVPLVVENKTGGAGLVGASYVAKAEPDGYTLLFLSCSAITEKPFIRKVPFDPAKGFSFICQVFDYGYGFCVKSNSPWKTFPEFVEAAKKEPGKLTVATSGAGSTMHVALTKLEAKIPGFKVTHVPYKASTMVVAAVVGGHVDACFQSPEWVPQVDSGELRLLAVPQKERWKKYPDVPTWLDLGYGVYARSQGAYVGPAGLPEEIRSRLEQEFKKALDFPGVRRVIQTFSLIEQYRPGKEVYEEVIKMYEENKKILPKYFPPPK